MISAPCQAWFLSFCFLQQNAVPPTIINLTGNEIKWNHSGVLSTTYWSVTPIFIRYRLSDVIKKGILNVAKSCGGWNTMSSDGKKILLSIIVLPLVAVFGALIIFGARSDTLMFVFGTNLLPMLIGGFFSGLLIRAVNRSNGAAANKRWIALAPVGVPLILGVLWYLLSIVNSGAFDSGREYFAGPIYLVGLAVVVSVIATIAYAVVPKKLN